MRDKRYSLTGHGVFPFCSLLKMLLSYSSSDIPLSAMATNASSSPFLPDNSSKSATVPQALIFPEIIIDLDISKIHRGCICFEQVKEAINDPTNFITLEKEVGYDL